MANVTMWDTDRFTEIERTLERCITTLEEQKSTILHLQETVNNDWVSEAGRAYSENIDKDLKDLEDILEEFKEIQEKIRETKNKYTEGEDELTTKLSSLYNALSV